jgi:hypothetical protein
VKKLLIAFINVGIGLIVGLTLFELVLRVNPGLLIRGMALPAPNDPPLYLRSYAVYYSDADEIFWRPDLIKPIPPVSDLLEAQVNYQTDEFGFRNQPPLPQNVDLVVLGRSYSLGAQVPSPWPELFANLSGMKVLNLSEPGSTLHVKMDYLRDFGLPRQPQWVIIEVSPKMDLQNSQAGVGVLSQQLLVPLLQTLLDKPVKENWRQSSSNWIYPIKVNLPGRLKDLVCCVHYMDFFASDGTTIARSQDWFDFQTQMMEIIKLIRSHSAYPVLLYVPSKPDIYFPLATDPSQLSPTLVGVTPFILGSNGYLVSDRENKADIQMVLRNLHAGSELLARFAREQQIAYIDPTAEMIASVMEGNDPFMVYDSHWNMLGHQIVAQSIESFLQQATFP